MKTGADFLLYASLVLAGAELTLLVMQPTFSNVLLLISGLVLFLLSLLRSSKL